MARNAAAKLRMIDRIIEALHLDLAGKTVLTEVGSNDFLFAPIIAARAGAASVRAWVKDTRFGTAAQIREDFYNLCVDLGLTPPVVIRENHRPVEDIKAANIVTNSHMVRPIDWEFIRHISARNSVISLMYEAWEARGKDISLDACRKAGVPVFGTWEGHPDVGVFEYVGPLAVKMAMKAGYEVTGNTILVWSSDNFGIVAADYFRRMKAGQVILTTDWDEAQVCLPECDFVFLCECHETRPFFDRDGPIPLEQLLDLNPGLGIVHLYGAVDHQLLLDNGLSVFPNRAGLPEIMSYTLAEAGCFPLFMLYAAGLKVGEEVLSGAPSQLCQPVVLEGGESEGP